jgi:hypothetical protein
MRRKVVDPAIHTYGLSAARATKPGYRFLNLNGEREREREADLKKKGKEKLKSTGLCVFSPFVGHSESHRQRGSHSRSVTPCNLVHS